MMEDPTTDSTLTPLLEVENLHVRFRLKRRVVHAVRGVSLRLHEGESIGIVGESGSGKSVMGRAIMGLLHRPAEVTVDRLVVDGRDPRKAMRGRRSKRDGQPVAMVFQNPFASLNPVYRVETLLTDVLTRRRGMNKQAAREEAVRLLDAVRIPAARTRLRSYPHEFSGGMQQRIVIALALALNPRVLIADEPTTALDVTVQAQILDLLRDLQRERRMGLIFVSHDLDVVSEVVSTVQVMYSGSFVEGGSVDRLYENPAHPYTRGLMASAPRFGSHGGRLQAIPGNPPDAARTIPGCAFHERCEFRTSICTVEVPETRVTPYGGLAACHHVGELPQIEHAHG